MTVKKRLENLWYVYSGNDADLSSTETLLTSGIDSLASVGLLVDLENEFDIDLDDGADEKIVAMTFKTLLEFIQKKVSK